ncbi:RING-type domain-containing protein [Rhodotorula toruloides]|nr:RING-type domain-containing protein [Rhodotorula toruloides]
MSTCGPWDRTPPRLSLRAACLTGLGLPNSQVHSSTTGKRDYLSTRMAPKTKKGKAGQTDAELKAAGQLDTASDFTSPSLSALESSLRCPICAEFFTAPVILTNCSHSFDSRCLRDYLAVHKRCPSCLAETDESRIRKNLALQEVLNAWQSAREEILRLEGAASSASTRAAAPSRQSPLSPTPSSTRRTRTSVYSTASASKGKRKAASSPSVKPEPESDDDIIGIDDSSDIEIVEDESSSAIRPPKKRVKGANGQAKAAADPTDPNLIVTCPICAGSFKNSLVALHVEKCNGVAPASTGAAAWGNLMNGGSSGASQVAGNESPSRANKLDTTKYLPLTSYSYKSVSELTEMLKEYALPTTVPPTCLTTDSKLSIFQRRHRQFLILWNANADLDPSDPKHKTPRQLREELSRWEKVQDANGLASGAGAAGQAEAKGGPVSKEHATKYAPQFRDLIAQARASTQAAKEKQRAAAEPVPDKALTPPVEAPTAPSDVAVAPQPPAPPSPPARKRSVRLVSPQRSPSPEFIAQESPASSPSPMLSPRHAGAESDPPAGSEGGKETKDMGRRRRETSPYNPEGPRPSQRNREEERMFAEMYGGKEDEEEETDGPEEREVGEALEA